MPDSRSAARQRYRDLHRAGHSMLLVSHEPRTIAAFCDRALLLEGGRIVLAGPADAVADRYLRTVDRRPGRCRPGRWRPMMRRAFRS